MKISDRYPIVVTDHKIACRDFWQRHFGLDVLFDSDWFVLLGNEQQGSVVAFMSPDHPSAPPGLSASAGKVCAWRLKWMTSCKPTSTLPGAAGRWRTR